MCSVNDGFRRWLCAVQEVEIAAFVGLEHVLDELAGHNPRRLMVFDSSPLLATDESHVLASHMGQVVMVVAAGRTRRQAVFAALKSLNDYQFVGLVLNMSNLPASENYYDQHYGQNLRALKGEA